jgi:hypothetical protein
VLRAGHAGNRLTLGPALFRDILEGRSGIRLSRHEFADTWSLLRTPDRRVHLSVPEMLEEFRRLADELPPCNDFPFVLMAGERRAYNANQIYRDPAWRKTDADGAMRMHPDDAAALELVAGARRMPVSAERDRGRGPARRHGAPGGGHAAARLRHALQGRRTIRPCRQRAHLARALRSADKDALPQVRAGPDSEA